MRELERWFKDRRGIPVRVIRWEPESHRVIYLRPGYPHECFSPLQIFKRDFRELEGDHESLNAIQANSNQP
ncbi:DUF4222 domain-containing protein [Cronobacter sakazakii]|nr:DUF4222 domain-containing protein [Cronobacter sakazakii]EIZ2217572.1 DUF4222 domain-containing protein [Cronobacter sakazakii]EIZ2222047.1 DUF4222 domain-containing protein [Cronobacter sakazakii]EIZ3632471.1 DUF4222 domain-containing protein [Cronobacter sakazakii]EIZ3636153.1 DUF4222 domain-containing protein [Cronobacter sakazakii]